MRIKIVTLNNTTNFGANMQMYALHEYLCRKGNDLEIINYQPKVIKKNQSIFNGIKNNFFKWIVLLPITIFRNLSFVSFRSKRLNISKKITKCSLIPSMFDDDTDMYIAGSDQIWNEKITAWDPGYFLNFSTRIMKIAYAASIGIDNPSNEYINKIYERLKSFKLVSVREESLFTCLRNKGLDVYHVLDPIFLLNQNDYQDISINPKNNNYVLIYTMMKSQDVNRLAEMIAKERNLSIINLSSVRKKSNFEKHVLKSFSVESTLGYFINADFVVTNSFHGTAFSILLKKNFYTLSAGNVSSRLKSILNSCKLDNRYVDDVNNMKITTIDYVSVNKSIEQLIKQSKSFLDIAIQQCKNDLIRK